MAHLTTPFSLALLAFLLPLCTGNQKLHFLPECKKRLKSQLKNHSAVQPLKGWKCMVKFFFFCRARNVQRTIVHW